MKKLSTIALLLIGYFGNAQYCTSGGPTNSNDSDLGDIFLTGDNNDINIPATCPGTTGLEDLTASQTADLTANNNYSLDIEFTACSGNWTNAGEVWIDYNINNIFDSNESLGTWTGTSPSGTQTFNFTVPSWVCNGTTRIRFMQQETSILPLDPCASYGYGAMIDAEITLSGGSCQVPGCTDSTALNFNPLAVIDDGSCLPAAGKNCDTAHVISSLPFSATGLSTALYRNDYNSSHACGSTYMDGEDYVFEYTATTTECITASISNASFSTGVFILDGCPDDGNTTCLAQDNGNTALANTVVNPGTYYIIVSTDPAFGGPTSTVFDINVTSAVAGGVGSTCGNPHIISGNFSQNGLTTSCFGNDYNSTMACNSTNMNGDDYVFEYTPTNDTCIEINISNAEFTTGIFLLDTCPDVATSCVATGVGSNASLTKDVIAGKTYYIVISTDGFPSSTSFNFNIQEIDCPTYKNFDCLGATKICQDYNVDTTYADSLGILPNEINENNICWSNGEFGSTNWYEFTSFQGGFLGFTIFPEVGPSIPTLDYDWAVFDITDNGCEGIFSGASPVVSCNYSGTHGPTGPNGLGTSHSEPAGGDPNNLLMPVDSGRTYVINVGNFSSNGHGYDIIFDTNGVISKSSIDAKDLTLDCGEFTSLESNFIEATGEIPTYSWFPGNLLNDSTLENPTTLPLDSTTDFIVTAKTRQCELTDTVTIEIEYADFTTLTDTALCFGTEFKISPEFEDFVNPDSLIFTWSPNINISSVSDSAPTIIAKDSITYYVEIANGICLEYDSITIATPDSFASVPSFFINDNYDIDGVAEVEFYNESLGNGLTYLWNFDDGDSTNEMEIFHVYEQEGTYNVMLRIKDTLGCTDSSFVEVVIPVLELPNIFTPNNDGHNDIYRINRLRPLSNLKIYNRWGKLVYETLDYQNDWDGGDLQDGLYFAELYYQSGREVRTYKGWFNISR